MSVRGKGEKRSNALETEVRLKEKAGTRGLGRLRPREGWCSVHGSSVRGRSIRGSSVRGGAGSL